MIGDQVPEVVEVNIKAGISLVFEHLAFLGMPNPEEPVTVHVYHSRDAMVDAYTEIYGGVPDDIRDLRFANAAPRNLASGNYVFIQAQHLWRIFAGDQAYLSSWGFNGVLTAHLTSLQLRAAQDDVVGASPTWLNEGIATFLVLQGLEKAGLLSYEFIRRESRRHLLPAPSLGLTGIPIHSLRDLETVEDFKRFGFDSYSYSMLAAEMLASQTSQRSLVSYYSNARPGFAWEQQFETTFEMSVDEFYDKFAMFAKARYPVLDIPDR